MLIQTDIRTDMFIQIEVGTDMFVQTIQIANVSKKNQFKHLLNWYSSNYIRRVRKNVAHSR